jgi:hypothetical protein
MQESVVIDYQGIIKEENRKAMLAVIKSAMVILKKSQPNKSPTNILIKFMSRYPGVVIPEDILARFPQTVTITLEHQFWGLAITDDQFSVTLEFPSGKDRIVVPFKAILGFQDQSANVGISLEGEQAIYYENDKNPDHRHIKSVNGNVITVMFNQSDSKMKNLKEN